MNYEQYNEEIKRIKKIAGVVYFTKIEGAKLLPLHTEEVLEYVVKNEDGGFTRWYVDECNKELSKRGTLAF